jgi:hypothetical protein
MANRDEMSFSRAFADARKEMGGGKTFTWRGNKYTTDLAEESGKSSRTPTESPRPQARRRPTEEVARSASAAIDRAEGRPATRPQQNPRRVPGPNEGTATSVTTPSIRSEPLSPPMPAPVRRAIEDAPPEDRRGATRIAEQGARKRVPGGAIAQAIRNFLRGEGPTDPSIILREGRNSTGMARGGMVKKGNTDRRKKGMFYDSKSPRGYK